MCQLKGFPEWHENNLRSPGTAIAQIYEDIYRNKIYIASSPSWFPLVKFGIFRNSYLEGIGFAWIEWTTYGLSHCLYNLNYSCQIA
ncbi:hypothetical protein XELAEV_18005859mg [Xenopus laevis]|uniref:Uncharacterized protein n=1 Tax=Xenopus laevis TaxID=8355 RepID=A0A974DXN0_XENLA|nr:hypothetical protein XELAEV_18005859mg [Xenopus laevis]